MHFSLSHLWATSWAGSRRRRAAAPALASIPFLTQSVPSAGAAPQRSQLREAMALPPEEMSVSSEFLAPICLVTQPPKEARGKRKWAHSYAGGQGQGIQDYFGPNKTSGDWGVSTGKNQGWGSLADSGLRAEKWDGSRHYSTPNPHKENK